MLLSDDLDLLDRCRYLSTQARQPVPWYEHTEVGYNYRLSNILAALGRGQLSRLDEMIGRRREIRDRYVEGLEDLPVRFLGRGRAHDDAGDNCWLTTLIGHDGPDADTIVETMGDEQIEVRHLWKPMHLQPTFAAAKFFATGASESLFRHGVTLPSGAALTNREIDRVIDRVTSALTY